MTAIAKTIRSALGHDNFDLETGFDDLEGDFASAPTAKTAPKGYEKRTPTDRAEVLYSEDCPACRGSGKFRSYAGRIVGDCFKCAGKGTLTFKTPKAKRDANRIKAADKREALKASNLEAFEALHPELAAWWAGSTFEFAINLREAVQKFGSLTEGQERAAYKCARKFAEAKEARATKVAAESSPVDVQPIIDCFGRAANRKVKHPKIRLLGGEEAFWFSKASAHGVNAGALYVKSPDGTYLGKIANGSFTGNIAESTRANLLAACADPLNAAIAYGKEYGCCSVCGRELSDPESVANGIGPICASSYF